MSVVPRFEEAIQRLYQRAEVGGWYKEDSTVPVRIGDLYATFDRLKALQESLRWYVEEDEIHEGDPDNQYWIDGKHKAMKLLGMEIE